MKIAIAPTRAEQHWSFRKLSHDLSFHQYEPSIRDVTRHWRRQLPQPTMTTRVACCFFAIATWEKKRCVLWFFISKWWWCHLDWDSLELLWLLEKRRMFQSADICSEYHFRREVYRWRIYSGSIIQIGLRYRRTHSKRLIHSSYDVILARLISCFLDDTLSYPYPSQDSTRPPLLSESLFCTPNLFHRFEWKLINLQISVIQIYCVIKILTRVPSRMCLAKILIYFCRLCIFQSVVCRSVSKNLYELE